MTKSLTPEQLRAEMALIEKRLAAFSNLWKLQDNEASLSEQRAASKKVRELEQKLATLRGKR